MTASTGLSDDRGVENKEIEFGGVTPLSSLIENYNGMPDNVFKVRARVKNAEHQDILFKTDGYMTAWMLYNLQNDKEAEQVFIGDNSEILTKLIQIPIYQLDLVNNINIIWTKKSFYL